MRLRKESGPNGGRARFSVSPAMCSEAFWRFQIPEHIRTQYGYPELTERAKRKILGLISAPLYGLHPAALDEGEIEKLSDANLHKFVVDLVAEGGDVPASDDAPIAAVVAPWRGDIGKYGKTHSRDSTGQRGSRHPCADPSSVVHVRVCTPPTRGSTQVCDIAQTVSIAIG